MREQLKKGAILLARSGRFVAGSVLWAVAAVAAGVLLRLPWWVALILIVLFWIGWFRRWMKPAWMTALAAASCGVIILAISLLQPRNDRVWWEEFSRLPRIEIAGDEVWIRDSRHFRWRESNDFDAVWEDRQVDLSKLTSLELIIEPFDDSELAAHTMLCFGFSDGQHIIVSTEARKEEGEQYSLLAGACHQFELIYIFGDERDFLTLRAAVRKSRVYAYPVYSDLAFRKALFLRLANAANALHETPLFYASLRQNCTSTLVQHIDRLRPDRRIGWQMGTIFPARSGRLLWEMGGVDTTATSFEEAKERYRIDDLIRKHAENPDFSELIRSGRGS